MSLPLSGKVAIVTGSSRSIGASIAQRLAADGANVVINYHLVDVEASYVANTINTQQGGRAIVVKADVSTSDGGKHLLDECVKFLGVPDILVLNAGIMGHRVLANLDEEYYDLHINTNVKGPLFLVKAAAEIMKAGSRIVFVTTTLTRASTVLPMSVMFTATKGAVEQIVRVLSKDLGQKGMTVNAIAPGAVDTPMFRDGKTPQLIHWISQLHPQKRIPKPEEISPLVAFLVSEEAAWTNGQVIYVNGAFAV